MALLKGYPTTDHIVELLVKAARLVEEVYHKPGTIRLRISFLDLPQLMSLIPRMDVAEEAKGVPGILGYQIHVLSTSATISYDPEVIPFDFWEAFCRVRREPQAENVFKKRLKQLIHSNETAAAAGNEKQQHKSRRKLTDD